MTENPNTVTLGLVQMRCTPEPSRNMAAAVRGVRDAAGRGAQIVCLQELFRSQYFCQTEDIELFKLAETIPGPTTDALSKVAKAANISRTHLSEKFKQITGTNFVEYVARARFEKACELLRDVDLRVSEIAFAVGFQSLSQFNRVFKKFSGKSPSAYRAIYSRRTKPR